MDVNTQLGRDMDCLYSTYSKHQLGLTLLELIVTLAIMAIVISIIPSVSAAFIHSNRVTAAVNLIAGDMSYARSEAVMRGQNVQLCKSSNGTKCIRTSQWESGWIIFVDENKNRKREEYEEILKYQPKLSQINITYKGSGSSNYIRFRADGQTGVNGTFAFCSDQTGLYKKALILFRTGRLRLSKTRTKGKSISCSAFRA